MDNQNDFSGIVPNSSTDRKKYLMSRLVVLENEQDINMKADAFISNFRKQLKIERQESLQRFRDMTRPSA